MKLNLHFNILIKKLFIFFCLFSIFILKIYSQPGPSQLYLLIFDKHGNKMTLKKDFELFSYIPNNNIKERGYYVTYGEKRCQINYEIICSNIIIESSINVISIIQNKDTMNLIIKNYSAYGFKLFIDSLVFNNGWYELKNDNKVGYNNKGQYILENNMNLKYDSCFTNLSKISSKYVISSAIPEFLKSQKNEIVKYETESKLQTVLAEHIEIVDSLKTKYIKYKYNYDGKEYFNKSVFPKNLKVGSNYQVFLYFEKSEPQKILEIKSYPHGY